MAVFSKPQLRRLPATDIDADLVCSVLEENGAAIIEGAVAADVIERLNRDLDPLAAATRPLGETKYGYRPKIVPQAKYITNLPGRSETMRRDILNNPVIHTVCEANFKRTGDYWLSTAVLREIAPGFGDQDFHRDEAIHPLLSTQKPDAAPIAISFILAVTKFTEENGATMVIPGSHRWAEVGTPSVDEAVPATMKAGDILVLRQGLVHAGGRHNGNADSGARRAILAYFDSCQLTPIENFRTMPREMVEAMTPLAQKMIGWRTLKPALPNVTGLNTVGMEFLENVLELKANQ
ncbi:Verruculogen synthase [Aspergillus carlsbadensis]|nr:Verruculogen synthase [Aspergillus carlsbadensis]